MKNRVEIDCPNARKIYDDKGVLFIRISHGRKVVTEGKFLVAPDSKAMWIEWLVEANSFKKTVETIPVTPEMLSGIQPASQTLLDDSGGKILFSIPIPILAVRDEKPSRS